MTFLVKYLLEPERVIPAIEIDARVGNPAIQGKVGSVIKAFTDAQLARINDSVLPYKIESTFGNLAGYFLLDVSSGTPIVIRQVFRPAFAQQFGLQLGNLITNFIANGNYRDDLL